MKNPVARWLSVAAAFLFLFSQTAAAAELNRLFRQVEKLKLERQGYVLGAKLSKTQLAVARATPVEATTPDTFKFRDENLFVVAQNGSNRVLVIYEQFEDASREKVQELVGDLYMSFEDPTVMAHDKIVYWAWAKKGKVSSKEFEDAKKDAKTLDILATVKCVSDIHIMEKQEDSPKGSVYYIISSDSILKFFAGQT